MEMKAEYYQVAFSSFPTVEKPLKVFGFMVQRYVPEVQNITQRRLLQVYNPFREPKPEIPSGAWMEHSGISRRCEMGEGGFECADFQYGEGKVIAHNYPHALEKLAQLTYLDQADSLEVHVKRQAEIGIEHVHSLQWRKGILLLTVYGQGGRKLRVHSDAQLYKIFERFLKA